ncbi:hypothetical protein TARUN_10330 [Trichoderma arundinaceum]|uniref:Uncharacterized protein n=1 Tax=Trichoderma arundinaceum TaxID=490622 RepID=A0A395N8C7_TRIAR|nr:hypothetical protein TARUN_10330 [Trichoderma arundinaceum]
MFRVRLIQQGGLLLKTLNPVGPSRWSPSQGALPLLCARASYTAAPRQQQRSPGFHAGCAAPLAKASASVGKLELRHAIFRDAVLPGLGAVMAHGHDASRPGGRGGETRARDAPSPFIDPVDAFAAQRAGILEHLTLGTCIRYGYVDQCKEDDMMLMMFMSNIGIQVPFYVQALPWYLLHLRPSVDSSTLVTCTAANGTTPSKIDPAQKSKDFGIAEAAATVPLRSCICK